MKKARSWFWFIVQLFPFIAFALFMLSRVGQAGEQYSSFIAMFSDFQNFVRVFQFQPISNAFVSVFETIGVSVLSGHAAVIHIISYEIFVLFCRIFYEVIAFLPKFCISFFERKM